jgi:parallel beta-helix repeat protein
LLLLFYAPISSFAGKAREPEEATPEPEETDRPEPVPTPPEPAPKAEKKKGTIEGKVVDERGIPLRGVEVSCIDLDGNIVARTLTDVEGKYVFKNLAEGNYTIDVKFSGLAPPLEIQFRDQKGLPPAPSTLFIQEISPDYSGASIIRTEWQRVAGVSHYRCELYKSGENRPILQYPDLKQNFCEFGNLIEDTEYEVRVYSKNNMGYSSTYATSLIRTKNRPPKRPFGLGVTYAKNNEIELLWYDIAGEDLEGYILQIKREDGRYLWYSKEELSTDRSNAHVITGGTGDLIRYRIDDTTAADAPLLENSLPYSFRVFAIDKVGNLSRASNPVLKVILEDTIPPLPIQDIQYEFTNENRLRISWETSDRDIRKYRVYYGVHRDRWDAVVSTNNTFYELMVNREIFENGELYVAIIAIDRAGNESGYRPLQKSTVVSAGEMKTENITLSSEMMYRDSSIAIREIPRKVAVKKAPLKKVPKASPKPKRYGLSELTKKGFVIESGETAVLSGSLTLPQNTIIKVQMGGELIITEAVLAPKDEIWGGIRFLEGSKGTIRDTVIDGAATGIAVLNIRNSIELRNIEVRDSAERGLYVKNSEIELPLITLRNNTIGLLVENSKVTVRNGLFENNEKGITGNEYQLVIEDSRFRNNSVYGVRLYGGGLVKGSVFQNNLVGIVFEEGRGKAVMRDCRIENNRVDGIVVSSSNLELRGNIIAGNERHGISITENANPNIMENDIINNKRYAVVGGGKINRCFIAYNNGSIYIDDTEKKGTPDDLFTSSTSGVIKQILNVDYIGELSYTSMLQ